MTEQLYFVGEICLFQNIHSLTEKTFGGIKNTMTITIRKFENSDHEYIAYAKSLCGKATYFLYFPDDIWGAVVLCNFVQMLQSFFQSEKLKITVHENAVCLKNKDILALLREQP